MCSKPERSHELTPSTFLAKGVHCKTKDGRERLDVVLRVDAQDANERQIFGVLRKCRNRNAEYEDKESGDLPHSMTSSARPRSAGGISMPIFRAVLRLMTSSTAIGCCATVSPGLAPFSILSV